MGHLAKLLRRGGRGELTYDPYWDYVSLLMHFDGIHGGASFVDETGKPINVSNVTNDTNYVKIGQASANFNGNSYLTIPYSSSYADDFNLGNSNFTIEFWIYLKSWSGPSLYGTVISKRQSGVSFDFSVINTGSTMVFQYYNGSIHNAGFTICNNLSLQNNWGHVCVMRKDGYLYGFLNGILQGQTTITSTLNGRNLAVEFGKSMSYSDSRLNAYLDEFRLTKAARYSENGFTPSLLPFPNHS